MLHRASAIDNREFSQGDKKPHFLPLPLAWDVSASHMCLPWYDPASLCTHSEVDLWQYGLLTPEKHRPAFAPACDAIFRFQCMTSNAMLIAIHIQGWFVILTLWILMRKPQASLSPLSKKGLLAMASCMLRLPMNLYPHKASLAQLAESIHVQMHINSAHLTISDIWIRAT